MRVFNTSATPVSFRDGGGEFHSIAARTAGVIPEGTPVTRELAAALRSKLRRLPEDPEVVIPPSTAVPPEGTTPEVGISTAVLAEDPTRSATPAVRPAPKPRRPTPAATAVPTTDTPPDGVDGST